MADLDEKAIRAACMANFHPDAEPSSVEMDKTRRSILAYLAAVPKVEAEAVAWNCVFPTHGHFTLRKDEADAMREQGAIVTPLYAAPPAGDER